MAGARAPAAALRISGVPMRPRGRRPMRRRRSATWRSWATRALERPCSLESLLAATGVISRMGSIEDGNTVSDAEPSEIHQQRSVVLSVAPLVFDGVKVNLLDTPGYGDFTGELRAGLRAADAALFVVSASDGIDAATTALWAECDQVGMPRAVVISRLDHPRANFEATVAACQRAFGDSVVPRVPSPGAQGPRSPDCWECSPAPFRTTPPANRRRP